MSIVIDTPLGIHYAALASEKARIRMEMVGLKGRGGSARARAIKHFGMKKNTSHAVVIERIQQEMDRLLELQKTVIDTVYADGTDRSGFTFGLDAVTPVTWKFCNLSQVPDSAYTQYSLGKLWDNAAFQKWATENSSVVMSLTELQNKVKEFMS